MSENGWRRWFAWRPIATCDGASWRGGTSSFSLISWLAGLRWLCVIERRAIDVENDLWHRTDRIWSYRVIPDYSR